MKYFFLSTFLLLTSSFLFSQNNKLSNSDYLVLEAKARALINANVDSSFVVANKIEKSDDFLHKAFAKGIKSYLYQIKGDTLNSNSNYKESFIYLDKSTISDEKIRINSLLLNYGGLIDWKRDKLNDALIKYKKAKILSEKINDFKQIIKTDRNTSLIYGQVGNHKLAISLLKKTDEILDKNEVKIQEDEFFLNKSILYLNLGSSYLNIYTADNHKYQSLESSLFYFKKAITYSKKLDDNRLSAQNNVAIIYYLKKNYTKAEKIYCDILSFSKENNNKNTYYNTSFNLGELYYDTKKYDKSEICFLKVDSIYQLGPISELEYIKSNYYLAKLYDIKKEYEKALHYSKLYLTKREEFETNLIQNKLEINFDKESLMLKKDMDDIQKKYKNSLLYKKALYVSIVIVFLLLVGFLLKTVRDKKRIDSKVQELIKEYSNNSKIKELVIEDNKNPKNTNTISIDDEKEEEIVAKLIALENKLFYLNVDFNQQTVAKKIKTNTTYLSYVVNKRFGKSFSEYSNELKINYIIKELITNPIYRKYSTQALAECVGFKNAISFSKSFNKRTGVSPVQFIKRLDKI